MKIYSNNKTVEFSVFKNGAMCKVTSTPAGSQIRTTNDVFKFIEWMTTEDPVDSENNQAESKFRLMRMINWWEMRTATYNHGSFNLDHYKKVVEARKLKLRKDKQNFQTEESYNPMPLYVLLMATGAGILVGYAIWLGYSIVQRS